MAYNTEKLYKMGRNLMNTIKINYNYDTDEAKIEFSDEFNSLPMIQQLDAMKDGLYLLMERYQEVNQGADMNDIGVRD